MGDIPAVGPVDTASQLLGTGNRFGIGIEGTDGRSQIVGCQAKQPASASRIQKPQVGQIGDVKQSTQAILGVADRFIVDRGQEVGPIASKGKFFDLVIRLHGLMDVGHGG